MRTWKKSLEDYKIDVASLPEETLNDLNLIWHPGLQPWLDWRRKARGGRSSVSPYRPHVERQYPPDDGYGQACRAAPDAAS